MRLEEHVSNLLQRRDHLLAVNARLAIPLTPQQQVNNTLRATPPQQRSTVPNPNYGPVENGVPESGMYAPSHRSPGSSDRGSISSQPTTTIRGAYMERHSPAGSNLAAAAAAAAASAYLPQQQQSQQQQPQQQTSPLGMASSLGMRSNPVSVVEHMRADARRTSMAAPPPQQYPAYQVVSPPMAASSQVPVVTSHQQQMVMRREPSMGVDPSHISPHHMHHHQKPS
ncbi:hypothetical protein B566_EDAN010766 [Ephemera danica]|nr:hypothetical protein B566_EDAN010766 [Ephemera danica]